MTSSPFSHAIAAIATAQGLGAVALLRVSGGSAGQILLRVCPGLGGVLPRPRSQRLLAVSRPGSDETLDRALVCWFPGPHSYTGEDCFEISCHGGRVAPQLVLDALLEAGARPALPGEFTRRAYLNGKLDLLQAEAVLDLVESRSRALHRAAVNQLERGLSRRIEELRNELLHVEALIAYGIDFPEEDEPPVPPARVTAAVRKVMERLSVLLSTAAGGELLRDGALVVLAGEPNSGKSSLFNALLGTERAIVTDVPGTTRDAIEATVELNGLPFRLVDTAGLRDTSDRVEGIGIEVARRYLKAADLVLFCVPAARPLDGAERAFLSGIDPDRLILVRTMADLGLGAAPRAGEPEPLPVSSLSGEGLGALGELLARRAFGALMTAPSDAPLLTRQRHVRALRSAHAQLQEFLSGMALRLPAEIAATHVRSAVDALEELIGVVTPDDVLGHLFGQFCVGK
jgi:tRNA modification GTPase